VKLFIDESLSPQLARWLNETGAHEAFHPLNIGRRGEPDHRVLRRCIEENRVIVTQNARDFRRLAGAAPIHPGLIILPALDREGTWGCLRRALDYLGKRTDPVRSIRNHVLEIRATGTISMVPLRSLK
jgi:predicted nuclease of predicted toxin-antitoxin system